MNEKLKWKNHPAFWVVLVTLIGGIVLFAYLLSINQKIERMRWQLMTIENRLGDTNRHRFPTSSSLIGNRDIVSRLDSIEDLLSDIEERTQGLR